METIKEIKPLTQEQFKRLAMGECITIIDAELTTEVIILDTFFYTRIYLN